MPRPLHFTQHEARAAQEGRMSQVRRILKPQPKYLQCWVQGRTVRGVHGTDPGAQSIPIPYAIGDLVPVRENFYLTDNGDYEAVVYMENAQAHLQEIQSIKDNLNLSKDWAASHTKKRSPVTMPLWASRLTARITDVRVQRVQGLSEADAMAMGGLSEQYDSIEEIPVGYCHGQDLSHRKGEAWFETPIESFQDLWNTTHGPDAWGRNDWIYVLTLDLIKSNIADINE